MTFTDEHKCAFTDEHKCANSLYMKGHTLVCERMWNEEGKERTDVTGLLSYDRTTGRITHGKWYAAPDDKGRKKLERRCVIISHERSVITGETMEYTDSYGSNALHIAVLHGQIHMLKLLLSRLKDITGDEEELQGIMQRRGALGLT